MNVIPSFESATESRLWVMLSLHHVEKAKRQVEKDVVLDRLKRFCQELRAAKLRYWHHDRQEPGEFDTGAGLLVEWADEVLEVVDGLAAPEYDRVRGGIQTHRKELAAHLEVPLTEREIIG